MKRYERGSAVLFCLSEFLKDSEESFADTQLCRLDTSSKLGSALGLAQRFHIARVNVSSTYDLSYHFHDYYEIFWVESGEGTHHINEDSLSLRTGDLAVIRPQDRHTFSATGKGMTIVNVAFPVTTATQFEYTYRETVSELFSDETRLPYMTRISPRAITRLMSVSEEAMHSSRTKLMLDYLLISIIKELVPMQQDEIINAAALPHWLRQALSEYSAETAFTGGTEDFARRCGRNQDYINRVMKNAVGCTLTQVLQKLKMKYATSQLALTTMPIKRIATNCGYKNLGQFYRVFESHFRCTPKQYRSASRKPV